MRLIKWLGNSFTSFLSSLLFMALSAQPYAKDMANEHDYLFSLSLSELLSIQVTGVTLTPQALKTAPSAVTIFTHEEIKRTGFTYLDELMNVVPGFQSYRTTGSGAISAFSSRSRRISGPAAEILVLVDGVRLNEPRGSGIGQVTPKYPLTNIERVEFIRGPGSAIYGSNAMMGVVNIITRESVNEVAARLDAFGGYQSSILGYQSVGEIYIELFAEFERDNGDEFSLPNTFGEGRVETDDPKNLDMFTVKFVKQTRSLTFNYYKLTAKHFFETSRTSDEHNVREVSLQSLVWQQEMNWQEVESNILLSYSLSNFITGSQRTAEGALFDISVPASNEPIVKVSHYDDYAEARFQWSNNWNLGSQRSMQFGVEYRQIDAPQALLHSNYDVDAFTQGSTTVSYYGTLTPTSLLQRASSRDIYGLYSQYQDEIINGTHLTLGVRVDYFSSIGSNTSPKVSLVHELNENHRVKLLYGEAFRAPTELELSVDVFQGATGNPNLESETVKGTEIIWLGGWHNMGASVGYFENSFENSITFDRSEARRTYKNSALDPLHGFEFEFSYEFNQNWLIRSAFTHIVTKDDAQYLEADDWGSLTVNYQYQNWNANFIASYQGEREMVATDDNGNRIVLPDYWLGFAKVIYRFSNDVESYLQIKNLTDKEYASPQAPARLDEGAPNRGREVLFGLSWQY